MDNNSEKTMHIDTSGRFYQKGNTGIAFKIIENREHKGMGLSSSLKKSTRKFLKSEKDSPRLYAICIYYLIKSNFNDFDILVICNDEKFFQVKKYLDILFQDNKEYSKKQITSLSKLRKVSGDKNIRSYADNLANIYRKKIFLNKQRKQKGIALNIIEINYKKISKKWKDIDLLIKK